MTNNGDIAVTVFAILVLIALITQTAYQVGYDQARAECKPLPRVEIKDMTHKQQVRALKYRDSGGRI